MTVPKEKDGWLFMGREYRTGDVVDYMSLFRPWQAVAGLHIGEYTSQLRFARRDGEGRWDFPGGCTQAPSRLRYELGRALICEEAGPGDIFGFKLPPKYWDEPAATNRSYGEALRDYIAALWSRAHRMEPQLAELDGGLVVAVGCPLDPDWTGAAEMGKLTRLVEAAVLFQALSAVAALAFLGLTLGAFWLKFKIGRMDGDKWSAYFENMPTTGMLGRMGVLLALALCLAAALGYFLFLWRGFPAPGRLTAVFLVIGALRLPGKMGERREELVIQATAYMFPPTRRDASMIGRNERFTPQEAAYYSAKIEKELGGTERFLKKAETLDFGSIPSDEDICGDSEGEEIRCRAGKSNFWVTWDGRMLPCGMLPDEGVELSVTGFAEAWKQITGKTAAIRLPVKCRNCSLKERCKICAAMTVTESGRYDCVPEYRCRMAQEYPEAFFRIAEEIKAGGHE